jgi:tRNA threonylcarbamoyl adenosine modification protein YeaZ
MKFGEPGEVFNQHRTGKMITESDSQLVLGIESAIAGGSIAFFRGAVRLASWMGENKLSGAEEILPTIDRLLRELSRDISDVGTIVVSTGPGSFTGIRVVISSVLGLKASTRARCLGLTAFQAVASSAEVQECVVALPMGRDMTCVQTFRGEQRVSEPMLIAPAELSAFLKRSRDIPILAHDSIYGRIFDVRENDVVNIGSDVASFLCQAAESAFATEDLHPLFVDRTAFTRI